MWKYVSRRIRDVCDRTYNVLDTRRPWQCGGERFCAENNHPEDHQTQQQQERKYCKRDESVPGATYCLLNVFKKNQSVAGAKPWNNDTGSNHSEREGFRRKEFCPSQHSWVGAITWVSRHFSRSIRAPSVGHRKAVQPWRRGSGRVTICFFFRFAGDCFDCLSPLVC